MPNHLMQERVSGDFSLISWHCDIMIHYLEHDDGSQLKWFVPDTAKTSYYLTLVIASWITFKLTVLLLLISCLYFLRFIANSLHCWWSHRFRAFSLVNKKVVQMQRIWTNHQKPFFALSEWAFWGWESNSTHSLKINKQKLLVESTWLK